MIERVIEQHGAAKVYAAIDGMSPGWTQRVMALGAPQPTSMADGWRWGNEAREAMTDAERDDADRQLRMVMGYLASACKTGRAPNRPYPHCRMRPL